MSEQKNILSIENLHVQIGKQMILHDISFDIKQGSMVGVIGPNGCGKTTLLNTISGFVPVDTGTISFDGQDIMNLPASKRARLGIGRTFQHFGVFRDLTVEDNIIIGAEQNKKYPWYWMFSAQHRKMMDQTIVETLDKVGLTNHRKSLAGVLSGGQIRLLELARLQLFQGKLLLIDEPTAGVAPALRQELANIIRLLNEQYGFTVMIVEHDLRFLFDLVDRAIVLVDGHQYMDGDPKTVQSDQRLQQIYFGVN